MMILGGLCPPSTSLVPDKKSCYVPLIPRTNGDVAVLPRGGQELVDISLRILIQLKPDDA